MLSLIEHGSLSLRFSGLGQARGLMCAVLLVSLLGCKPNELIRSYTVPKSGPGLGAAALQPAAADTSEPTHRMLALLAPGDSQAWFFKLVGEKGPIDGLADAVKAFYAGVRIGDDGRPTWTLPDGWQETPPSGMRLATITVVGGAVADGLEMSVIGLPLTGNWDAQALDNVNRWRGQLGLSPTGAPGLALATKPVEGLNDGLIVDLVGAFSGGMTPGMTPPFAGGRASAAAPPEAKQPAAPVASPLKTAAPPEAVAYTAPDGWVDLGPKSLRKINLLTSDDERAAQVYAMPFAAFAQMADPVENVNRWRRQVGLTPLAADEINEQGVSRTIAGQEAVLFQITPDADDAPAAITAAMSTRGDSVWFFMLKGPPETVEAEQPRFDDWLASIRFGDEGEPDNEQAAAATTSSAGPENKNDEGPTDGDR